MSAPTPLQLLTDSALRTRELLACLDEIADGFMSEPDVEPDWNDPDNTLGYGGAEPEKGD